MKPPRCHTCDRPLILGAYRSSVTVNGKTYVRLQCADCWKETRTAFGVNPNAWIEHPASSPYLGTKNK